MAVDCGADAEQLKYQTRNDPLPRAIGQLWESRSGGKGVFLVVEKVIEGRAMRSQMIDKLGT